MKLKRRSVARLFSTTQIKSALMKISLKKLTKPTSSLKIRKSVSDTTSSVMPVLVVRLVVALPAVIHLKALAASVARAAALILAKALVIYSASSSVVALAVNVDLKKVAMLKYSFN